MTGTSRFGRSCWAAWRLAWRARPGVVTAYLAVCTLSGLLPVAAVWLLSTAAASVAGGRALVGTGLAIVVTGLVAAVVPSVAQFMLAELLRATGRAAQDALFAATDRLSGLVRFEDPAFRDRLRLAQYGGRTGPGQVVDGVVGVVQGAVTIVGLALVLARVNPVMTVVALLAAVPALVAEIRVSRLRADVLLRTAPVERREFFYGELLTSLDAAKEVRLLGLGGLFRRRMLTELTEADRRRRCVDRRDLWVQISLAALAAVVSGAGLLWTVVAGPVGAQAVGALVAYLGAIGGLQAAVAAQVNRVATVHQAVAAFDHFVAVEDTPADLLPRRPGVAPVPLTTLRHGITLEDVWFRYSDDGPWVLRGVDLHIPHGCSLAIVGLNGAGKSTLVKLLCRFYDPTRGRVLWDGLDIRDVAPADLRARIAAVFQDFVTYDLSAADNVGLGDVGRLDDRSAVQAAATRAGVDPMLRELPRGYDTLLSRSFEDPGDGDGVPLSGGQWQRVALARAFMRQDRDLLLLDEPNAGLDAAAERDLHRRLAQHHVGATRILISHRLGSLRGADRVVVLADGVIAESGSHADLVDLEDGLYADLFAAQADGYREVATAGPAVTVAGPR
ncbi:ABC transporter ATP-binding protein [Jatrophihabitans sp. YIM 134969]